MEKSEPSRRAPQAWIDAIALSEADLAAGRVCDLDPFLRQLEAEDAATLKADTQARKPHGPAAAE